MLIHTTTQPFFSVIIPIYNNEPYLENCISSILSQSCPDFELILVDDGSTDRSSQICDDFASKDNRICVIHRENNGGVAAARNDGLAHASGEYVVHVDGDDWIAKELLETARQTLDQNDSPDMYIFSYVEVQSNSTLLKKLMVREGLYNKEQLRKEIYPGMICRVGKRIQNGIDSGALWDKIIKKKLLEKHYCRDLSLFCGEDSVCAWECMYFAETIYFSNLNLYFYNCVNVNSSTNKYHVNLYENNKAVAKYLRKYLTEKIDIQIERQINVLEFRGIVRAIRQEVNFRHDILDSAELLKKKCKDEKIVCPIVGLPNSVYPYVWLLNLKCFKTLLVSTGLRYCVESFFRFVNKKFGKITRGY